MSRIEKVVPIPKYCRARIEKGNVIIERGPQKGDFMYIESDDCIFIYKSNDGCGRFQYYASTRGLPDPYNGSYPQILWADNCIFATEEQKQMLINKLRLNGRDWDETNLRVIKYVWTPNNGDTYYFFGLNFSIMNRAWSGDDTDALNLSQGNVFESEEYAKNYASEIIDILKNKNIWIR